MGDHCRYFLPIFATSQFTTAPETDYKNSQTILIDGINILQVDVDKAEVVGSYKNAINCQTEREREQYSCYVNAEEEEEETGFQTSGFKFQVFFADEIDYNANTTVRRFQNFKVLSTVCRKKEKLK